MAEPDSLPSQTELIAAIDRLSAAARDYAAAVQSGATRNASKSVVVVAEMVVSLQLAIASLQTDVRFIHGRLDQIDARLRELTSGGSGSSLSD